MDQLMEVAAKRVRSFGAAEVSLALDGLARLRCQPPTVLLDALAQQVISQDPTTCMLSQQQHHQREHMILHIPTAFLLHAPAQLVTCREDCARILRHHRDMQPLP